MRTTVVIALALSACGVTPREPATTSAPRPRKPVKCALDDYTPTSVTPHFEDDRVAKLTTRRLRGVDVYIQAQPGLTAEWLRLQLARYAVVHRDRETDCALDVAGTEIEVESRGPGFVVTVRARDEDMAREVLRRGIRSLR